MKSFQRVQKDVAFALTVGFCSVPVLVVGYFHQQVRETYAAHFNSTSGRKRQALSTLGTLLLIGRCPGTTHSPDFRCKLRENTAAASERTR